jgi:hypothetical protein
MKFSARAPDEYSSRTLTVAANAAFVPIGIVTVLLGPLLPTLSTQRSLNYEKAGALFTIEFLALTVWVTRSGVCISRWGFRFAIKAGLLAMWDYSGSFGGDRQEGWKDRSGRRSIEGARAEAGSMKQQFL